MTTTLRALYPIAIMPGGNPLGTPRGISPELDKRIAQFCEAQGDLPVILLVPRGLRPGEALSWSAYLALGEDLPGVPGHPEPLQAIGEEKAPARTGDSRSREALPTPQKRKCPRGRPRETSADVDREIVSLAARGLGVETIRKILLGRGVNLSERSISERLKARQGELGL